MRRILGVDGGGSKTLAVVADERGRILGIGRAGGSNHQAVGMEEAMRRVEQAARQAMGRGGVAAVDAAAFALSGADLPEDFALLTPALEALDLAPHISLDNDSVAILRSGADNPNRVAVGWGSGTNGVARNAAGAEFRLPALGWISGDWGGGGQLATEAVSLTARAWDRRGEPTMLADLVLEVFDVPDGEGLIALLHTGQAPNGVTLAQDEIRRRLHLLPPLVFRAAAAGDQPAARLVDRSAEEVTRTALALLGKVGLTDEPADVVLGGSVFKAEGDMLTRAVRALLTARAPRARVVRPDVEPVVGAMFIALDMLGVTVNDEVRARARESYGAAAEEVAV